jgi:SAM-dependent methyltransferase
VVEIGCGSGGLLVAAARRGIAIQGVDIALRWLVLAQRRLEGRGLSVPLTAAAAKRLPWPDRRFDAVVADSVLEHLNDPARALREWLRVLRPGGRLVVWSPNRFSCLRDPHVGLWGLGWLPRGWVRPYVQVRRGCGWPLRLLSGGEARVLAEGAGFVRVRVEPPSLTALVADDASTALRAALRGYEAAARRRGLSAAVRAVAPLWQLTATRPEAR